jgi:hypothetical protein
MSWLLLFPESYRGTPVEVLSIAVTTVTLSLLALCLLTIVQSWIETLGSPTPNASAEEPLPNCNRSHSPESVAGSGHVEPTVRCRSLWAFSFSLFCSCLVGGMG